MCVKAKEGDMKIISFIDEGFIMDEQCPMT